jgi:hypothetical protein
MNGSVRRPYDDTYNNHFQTCCTSPREKIPCIHNRASLSLLSGQMLFREVLSYVRRAIDKLFRMRR